MAPWRPMAKSKGPGGVLVGLFSGWCSSGQSDRSCSKGHCIWPGLLALFGPSEEAGPVDLVERALEAHRQQTAMSPVELGLSHPQMEWR